LDDASTEDNPVQGVSVMVRRGHNPIREYVDDNFYKRISMTISTNEYRMWAISVGEGAPVVLVYGALCDYGYWERQLVAFAPTYRTDTLKRDGCNHRSVPYRSSATIPVVIGSWR
jgi:hypothetical protein